MEQSNDETSKVHLDDSSEEEIDVDELAALLEQQEHEDLIPKPAGRGTGSNEKCMPGTPELLSAPTANTKGKSTSGMDTNNCSPSEAPTLRATNTANNDASDTMDVKIKYNPKVLHFLDPSGVARAQLEGSDSTDKEENNDTSKAEKKPTILHFLRPSSEMPPEEQNGVQNDSDGNHASAPPREDIGQVPGAYAYENGTLLPAAEANAEEADDDFDWHQYQQDQDDVVNLVPGPPEVGAGPVDLVTANPVADLEGLQTAQLKSRESAQSRDCCYLSLLVTCAIVAISGGIVLWFVFKPNDDSGDTSVPSGNTFKTKLPRKEHMLSLLPNYTVDEIDVKNYSSSLSATYQTRAFNWTMHDPSFDSYDDMRLLERFALACLYFCTGGNSWQSDGNWLSYEIDETSWYESLNDFDFFAKLIDPPSDTLTRVWLSGNGLSGSIPPELFLITTLKFVDFSLNENLIGVLPSEIGNLHQLDQISLFRTSLSGTLPTEIGQASNLLAMFCSRSRIQGQLPSEFGLLGRLLYLQLQETLLSGEIPSEVGLLPLLVHLDLAGDQLGGTLPTELGQLSTLLWLNLDFNHITGTIPSELGGILQDPLTTHYDKYYALAEEVIPGFDITFILDLIKSELDQTNTGLSLEGNSLGGTIPSELGRFVDAQSLWLESNQLSGRIPSELGLVQSLQDLYFSSNELSGEIPSELGLLTRLRVLDLESNQLSGKIPSEIGLLTSLRSLYLGSNQLSEEIPKELGLLTSLRSLYLGSNQLSEEIPKELGLLTNLH
ncbi:LRR receptor-like serine threonine-protein kinase [Seminavis robusta]|uniref:LRR receptor-like serine threonine-protein kinase n=1 Tax=Seminavis robusta TaxID=568900 RepID=A0A9N8HA07_9STRA|nr:LRR receptor-like serine threonine-protein kinase [Seminavis robusta]|eukprot:Sro274_g105540.1 LRR receptor-like serine threonine-protein kinase (776) ;mRNA; r:62322-64649